MKQKNKFSYRELASIVAEAHKKLDILAKKFHELQTYFIAFVEYKGDNIQFNHWMNNKIKEMQSELQGNEQSNEQNMERSTADQG